MKKNSSSLDTKKRLIFSAIIFILPFFLIIISEAGLRITIWLKNGVPGKSYGLWRYDEELCAIHGENRYNTHTQTNNFGFRGREKINLRKTYNSIRIVAYGGSTTYCYNLQDGETWPEIVQFNLQKIQEHENDQVLNGGHIVWGISQLYKRAQRELTKLDTDIVILYTGINEDSNTKNLVKSGYDPYKLIEQNNYGVVPKNLDQCRWLKRNSTLIRFYEYYIKSRIFHGSNNRYIPEKNSNNININLEKFKETWSWKNYKIILFRFIDLIKSNGAKPVFIVQCGLEEVGNVKYFLSFSVEAAKILKDTDVAVLDVCNTINNNKDYFHNTGVHYSKKGAILFGQLISDYLIENSFFRNN